MALLRIAALLALGACGKAGAQPTAPSTARSGISAPTGWSALPDLAKAVSEATKVGGVAVDGVEAWGETARGCYAVWFALSGAGANADAVIAGLAAEKLVTSNVVKPEAADGVTSLMFAKPPYTGRLRVRTEGAKLTAIACFANQREPRSCEVPCTALLGAIP